MLEGEDIARMNTGGGRQVEWDELERRCAWGEALIVGLYALTVIFGARALWEML